MGDAVSGRTNPLQDGTSCSSVPNATLCASSYEHKSRHTHRDSGTGTGHSLKGEVHLCEWRKFRTRVDRMRLCRRGSVLDRVRALRAVEAARRTRKSPSGRG